MEEIFQYVTLALLGLLVVTVLKNMFWGAKRGTKRSLIRIISMVFWGVVMLFLTPVISRMVWGMFQDTALNALDIDELSSMLSTFEKAGLKNLALNLPLALGVNAILFIVLQLTIGKWLSYITFRIISGIIAPKKNSEGEKIGHNKLFGMLVGVAQGFIAFFLIMIPINALFYSVGEIENHKPTLSYTVVNNEKVYFDIYGEKALLAFKDEETGDVTNIHDIIRTVDKELNGGAYGIITKITGMQWFSSWGSNPLYTVPGTSVNFREDLVSVIELTRDLEHVINLFDGFDMDKLANLTDAQYSELEAIVDRLCDITILQAAMDGDITVLLEEFLSLKRDDLPDTLVGDLNSLQTMTSIGEDGGVYNQIGQMLNTSDYDMPEDVREMLQKHYDYLNANGNMDNAAQAKYLAKIIDEANAIFYSELFSLGEESSVEGRMLTRSLIVGIDECFSADFMRDNFKSTLDIAQLIFSTPIEDIVVASGEAPKTFYITFVDFFNSLLGSIDDTASAPTVDITTAATNLKKALNYEITFNGKKQKLAKHIFDDGIGKLPLFSDLLFGPSTNDIHATLISSLLSDFATISVEDAKIDDFSAVMGSISNLLISVADLAPELNEVITTINGGEGEDEINPMKAFADLLTPEFITNISDVLDALTNPYTLDNPQTTNVDETVWGISKIVRRVVAGYFLGMQSDEAPAATDVSVDALIYDVLNGFSRELNSDNQLPWKDTLYLFSDLTPMFALGDDDLEDGMDAMLKEVNKLLKPTVCVQYAATGLTHSENCNCKDSLLTRLRNNAFFADAAVRLDALIADFAKEGITNALPTGWEIDFGDLTASEVADLVVEIVDTMLSVADKLIAGDANLDDPEKVDEFINTAMSAIDSLATSGVRIKPDLGMFVDPNGDDYIDLEAQEQNIKDALDNMLLGAQSEEDVNRITQLQKALWVFGLTDDKPWVTPPVE